jgi:hypothetical protein
MLRHSSERQIGWSAKDWRAIENDLELIISVGQSKQPKRLGPATTLFNVPSFHR